MTTTIEMPISDTMALFDMGSEMAQLSGGYRKYRNKRKRRLSNGKRKSLKRKSLKRKSLKRKSVKRKSLKRKRSILIQKGGSNLADIDSMYSSEDHPEIKMECPGSMTESGCGVLSNLAVLDQVFK